MRLSIFKFLFLALIYTLPLSAEMLSRTKVGMGTFLTLSLEESKKHHFSGAFKILEDVENSLSSYKPNTPISILNATKKVKLDTYSYEALLLSQKYYQQSDGYFNITVGSITKKLYRFGEDEHIPTKKELTNAEINFNAIEFNKVDAYLADNATVDLGGMGKGYGVDKVVEYLKAKSINKVIVALSGDIRCLGICKIDIQDPLSEYSFASFQTKKKETAISTSGNYNRYVGSTKNNHLVNPKSKKSQERFLSITLLSQMPNSDLDAYATAASVMPRERAYQFLESLDLAYIVIESDGEFRFSDNLYYYLGGLVIY